MRKGTIMVALVALLVAIFATAAYAALIEGGSGNNDLFETSGDDSMFGYRGNDVLDANNFGTSAAPDDDFAAGGGNNDRVLVNDGDSEDVAKGGAGSSDVCVVTDQSEVGRGCETVRVNPLNDVAPGT